MKFRIIGSILCEDRVPEFNSAGIVLWILMGVLFSRSLRLENNNNSNRIIITTIMIRNPAHVCACSVIGAIIELILRRFHPPVFWHANIRNSQRRKRKKCATERVIATTMNVARLLLSLFLICFYQNCKSFPAVHKIKNSVWHARRINCLFFRFVRCIIQRFICCALLWSPFHLFSPI